LQTGPGSHLVQGKRVCCKLLVICLWQTYRYRYTCISQPVDTFNISTSDKLVASWHPFPLPSHQCRSRLLHIQKSVVNQGHRSYIRVYSDGSVTSLLLQAMMLLLLLLMMTSCSLRSHDVIPVRGSCFTVYKSRRLRCATAFTTYIHTYIHTLPYLPIWPTVSLLIM